MEKKPEIMDKNSFDYLLSTMETAVELTWKYTERSWEIFKYYITIMTVVGGLFIGILTAGFSIDAIRSIFPIAALILFIIGWTIFIQLINVDLDNTRAIRHHRILIKHMKKFSNLNNYFTDYDKIYQVNNGKKSFTFSSRWTLKNIFKRSIIASGVKTQLVLINSGIGTVGFSIYINNIFSIELFWKWVIPLLFCISLITFHGIVGFLRGRALKYLDE